jgi:hypothetical protein
MSKKRGFRVFQTHGWIPGTKISYYAQRPITEVGSQIKSQKTKRRLKKKRG